jgi:hypothetical protein
MDTLIVRPDKKKLKAVKEMLKKMEIPFETTSDRIYNEAFEEKLKRSDASFAKEEYTVFTTEDLWK